MARTHQHIVYIYNDDDKEIEVDMSALHDALCAGELLEDGFPYGIMTHDGEEVMLTKDEQERAKDAYNLKIEEYEAEDAGYYHGV